LATPSIGFPKEAVSRLRRGLFFSYIGLSFDDDRTAHRGMVKAITVSRLQVVHSQGSADPWVVGHCCCVCNKGLAASLLQSIHKCLYNDRSQVTDIGGLTHVSFNRYDEILMYATLYGYGRRIQTVRHLTKMLQNAPPCGRGASLHFLPACQRIEEKCPQVIRSKRSG
jgi:hypothetical protein